MKKVHVVCLALLLGSVFASSENNWLNGKVTDQDGDAITGALVWFSTHEATAVTDSLGQYQFGDELPVCFTRQRSVETGPVLSRNSLSFNVSGQPASVRLEVVDLAGKCVKRVVNEQLSPRNYLFALPAGKLPVSMCIISLKINDKRFTWRALVGENGILHTGTPSAALSSNNSRSAKLAASLNDTLHCTREKYFKVDTVIVSYEGTIDITMESIDAKGPYVKILGGDTVQYAFQDSITWLKYWNTDSFSVQIEYNYDSSFLSPPTNTTIDMERSSFVRIPYQIYTNEFDNDTTASRLLVLYDSSKTDTEKPVITLDHDTVELTKGELFDLRDGLTITDVVDSHIVFMDLVNITDDIRTTAERIDVYQINFDVPGTYTVTYRVMDTHMNMAEAKRTIIVTK
ncbi:MAG: hypothetical protein JW913_12155 [Chitinispirillaceae bacterium]|nr:hypothetical protein [Chitinispirillaceae bacterium]